VSPQFEGGIVSNTFNRGTSFLGDRAAEKRAVRDDCVPAKNAPCAAAQVRKSCRLWAGTKLEAGLCRRRNAEGDLIETTT
jgi:GH24 family phage-related lysozyme (muramidase)